MLLDRVLLETEGRQLGKELLREPGADDELEPAGRRLTEQQLVELVSDPLGRHDLEPLAHRTDRGDHARGRLGPEVGGEAGGPEHPQGVVGERDLRVERRVEDARGERLHAREGVDERPLGEPDRHRVDREVAS